ncbi:dnaK protein [Histomonas meleagridis]|uniref:dnaK protein n=1 Tax=Histomonas meleagridis TaxID=135588 RepID=UPI00355A4999|nr:dnaK protein [Histomonas meleagridis]KAH0800600.1 dnaK protein [Histomonas meleagridis]
MLFFLINFYTLDIGTEFFKAAEVGLDGNPMPIKFPNNKDLMPTSIAFKTQNNTESPLTPQQLNSTEIKFGKSAAGILCKKESLGFSLLPMTFGRNIAEFMTSRIVHPIQAFAIFIDHIFKKKSIQDGLLITVPAFWTTPQRSFITNACAIHDIPLLGIVDDTEALSQLYSATKYSRYMKLNSSTPYRVLFIDVGSTSTKVYGFSFVWNNNQTNVTQEVTLWNEHIGGYHFKKLVSEKKGISLKKSEKLLKTSYDRLNLSEILSENLNDLFSLINTGINQMQSLGELNEIQVIGGCSAYPFVMEVIRSASKNSSAVIRKEFSSTNSIAFGTVYFGLQLIDSLPYPPMYLTKTYLYNLNITIAEDHKLSERNGEILPFIREYSQGSRTITIKGDFNDLPRGTSNILQKVMLTNLTNMTFEDTDKPFGIVRIHQRTTQIESVEWCKNENKCENIGIIDMSYDKYTYQMIAAQTSAILRVIHSRDLKMKKIEKIRSFLMDLEVVLGASKIEDGEVAKQLDAVKKLSERFEGKSLNELTDNEVNEGYELIDGLVKTMREQEKKTSKK